MEYAEEEAVSIGGAENGSISSSCRAGRSRISIDEMESFMPWPLLCPLPLRFRTRAGLYPSSRRSSSSSVSVNSRCRGGEDVTDDGGLSSEIVSTVLPGDSSMMVAERMGDLWRMDA